jgi:hypothetical protein
VTVQNVDWDLVKQLEAIRVQARTLVDSPAKYLDADLTATEGLNIYERFYKVRQYLAAALPPVAHQVRTRAREYKPSPGIPPSGSLVKSDLQDLERECDQLLRVLRDKPR